ncbi:MAG: response regulator [Oscillospiraceae bacterium]|nr:response regulator [Oscillospiraceae bacterium]
MEKAISVVVADLSSGFRHLIGEMINEEENMYLAGATDNGLATFEMIEKMRPTVLITDLYLRNMEGPVMLQRLKDAGIMPHTAVVSTLFNEQMAEKLDELGVELYLSKPFSVERLLDFIRGCGEGGRAAAPTRPSDMERLVEDVLGHSFVMPYLKGWKILREALLRIMEDPEMLTGVTKVLYPELARHFGTGTTGIERCIRNALDVAWREGDAAAREAYFGADFAPSLRKRPGNVRYMKLAAEYMSRRMRQKE